MYQNERWDATALNYGITGLAANAVYVVRLDFSENYYNAIGQRTFDIALNGGVAQANYDIFRDAGAMFKATTRSFTAKADASGKITLTLTNKVGGAKINGIEVTPTAAGTVRIASVASGSAVPPGFVADSTYINGGTTVHYGQPIDTSGVVSPASQGVYQDERWDANALNYNLTGLVANAFYVVRLDFSENYFTGIGQRMFDISLNGSVVQANYDIFGDAGAKFKATARSFTAKADTTGKITLALTNKVGGAKVDGIEITPGVNLTAGSTNTYGSFAPDAPYVTDIASTNTYSAPANQAIDLSGVSNPAPVDVYRNERWSSNALKYNVFGLVPGSVYVVRLDFSENYYTGTGQRTFNVSINGSSSGTLYRSNYDIYATAGNRKFKATYLSFDAVADASGQILIALTNTTTNGPGGAKVDGVEVQPKTTTTTLGPDLAQGKSISASSSESSAYSAGNAVDGNSTTRWSSGQWMQPNANAWISVDLGSVQAIDTVRLNWEAAYAVAYNIQVSNDGVTWTTVRSITNNSTAGVVNHAGLATGGRYVRVNCSQTSAGSNNYSLYDFKVYS